MATSANQLKITIDEEVRDIFKATRLRRCTARYCIHNTAYVGFAYLSDPVAECKLKNISIGDDSRCSHYETKSGEPA